MGPEERKVSSVVHRDALRLFHPHVGKLLCWSYIKLLKANKATLLGSLKVYFYLVVTFALGVRHSSRKPTRAASMERIWKRTGKKPCSLYVLPACKWELLLQRKKGLWANASECTRGWWNSIGVWNTKFDFPKLVSNQCSPAWSGFAWGLPRERVSIALPGSGMVFSSSVGHW